MAARIKFFRDRVQAQETLRFLNAHRIRGFVRERLPSTATPDQELFGFDLFVLRDDDVDNAKKLLSYEYGNEWGEGVA